MLLPRSLKLSAVILAALSASIIEAEAGLYGFHHYNPQTKQERILNLREVPENINNHRANMRDNLLMLIRYAKQQNPNFQIVTHEGQDLLTKSLWEHGREGYNRARRQSDAEDASFLFHHHFKEQEPERDTPAYEYLNLVDAIAINSLYCGNGHESPITKNHNLGLITIEQCASQNDMDSAQVNSILDKKMSYTFNKLDNAFNNIDDHNSLNDSSKNVYKVSDAQNILILTDDSRYQNKNDMVKDLIKTNYDIIIIKPLFANHERFTTEDLQRLHFKKNGAKRLLLAEFNVTEASPDDYFWLKEWNTNRPEWLPRKSFNTPNAFIAEFWQPEWKKIISRYFKDVVNEGFDGVFFTGIENYQYFESLTPLE